MAEWDDYARLTEEAADLPYGPTRTALLEEAVRLADAIGDLETQYDTRMELVAAASFGGAAERALVAFTWCLKKFDETPDAYDEYDLLWSFKWILGSLPDFVNVSRQKIESVQDDFENRLLQLNYGLAPLYKLKCRNALDLGDVEATRHWYAKWKAAPYDPLQDCPACQVNTDGETQIFLGHPEEGLNVLAPVLKGKLSCHAVPNTTYGLVLEPLTVLGRDEEATRNHRTGYRTVSGNPDFLGSVADHLVYSVRIGDTAQGSRIFQKHLPIALNTMEDEPRREFLVASSIFLRHLADKSHRKRKLTVPDSLACHRADHLYDCGELSEWFQEYAGQCVAEFDRRNGNDYYSKKMLRLAEYAGVSSV